MQEPFLAFAFLKKKRANEAERIPNLPRNLRVNQMLKLKKEALKLTLYLRLVSTVYPQRSGRKKCPGHGGQRDEDR